MSWKERIRDCYRQGLQTTGGLYEEQEAIIEVVEALLEEQNAKNIIEITARCKETTEALLKETEQRVLEDCITTLLGCNGDCVECDADNETCDVYCPYRERLEQLREKYNKGGE
jgi:hypothetical protein